MPESVRDDAVIVFTSHSLPLKVVERGDPYPQQMAATVQSVMQAIGYSHPYVHAWQSKVGRLPWIGMSVSSLLLLLSLDRVDETLNVGLLLLVQRANKAIAVRRSTHERLGVTIGFMRMRANSNPKRIVSST